MSDALVPANPGEFLFYQTDDGRIRLQVRMGGETVWLTQKQMADLFQTTPQNVTMHIAALYGEGELAQVATCKDFLQVQIEGSREVQRSFKYYNLDVIISVGYRVKSLRGTQFRIWATQRLRELIVKGFTIDDDRLRNAGGGNYFEELRVHGLATDVDLEVRGVAVGAGPDECGSRVESGFPLSVRQLAHCVGGRSVGLQFRHVSFGSDPRQCVDSAADELVDAEVPIGRAGQKCRRRRRGVGASGTPFCLRG